MDIAGAPGLSTKKDEGVVCLGDERDPLEVMGDDSVVLRSADLNVARRTKRLVPTSPFKFTPVLTKIHTDTPPASRSRRVRFHDDRPVPRVRGGLVTPLPRDTSDVAASFSTAPSRSVVTTTECSEDATSQPRTPGDRVSHVTSTSSLSADDSGCEGGVGDLSVSLNETAGTLNGSTLSSTDDDSGIFDQSYDSVSPEPCPDSSPPAPTDHFVPSHDDIIVSMTTAPKRKHLIGRKMGLDRVDVVWKLHKRHLSDLILRYLDTDSLKMASQVSAHWNTATRCSRDMKSIITITDRSHSSLTGKENLKAPTGSARSSTTTRTDEFVRSPRSSGRPLCDRDDTRPTADTHPSHIHQKSLSSKQSLHHLYVKESTNLPNDRKLTQCPYCRSPAVVAPLQHRAVCTNYTCLYDYCKYCHLAYHGSMICSSRQPLLPVKPMLSSRQRTVNKLDVINSHRSKQMLKRL